MPPAGTFAALCARCTCAAACAWISASVIILAGCSALAALAGIVADLLPTTAMSRRQIVFQFQY